MIAIDIGNSRIKWAHFIHGERQSGGVSEYSSAKLEQHLDDLQIPLEYGRVFISLVAAEELKARLGSYLDGRGCSDYEFVAVKTQMLGITCVYKQPEKFGVDRWLAMIAGYYHESRAENEALCVLDCGTAITLDFVDAKGRHLGGWIMPGYRTMIHSLAMNTARLEIEQRPTVADRSGLADNTADAIDGGVSKLLMHGLSSMIEEQSTQIGAQVCCLVTGGDADWLFEGLYKKLGSHCIHEPYLVLQGIERVSRESRRIKHK